MRFVVVFLALFVPLAVTLWLMSDPTRRRPGQLPDDAPEASDPSVLTWQDVSDGSGFDRYRWKIRKLDGVGVQVVDKGYVQFYLAADRLERVDGAPRLEGVVCAVFDEPIEDRPNLRLTIESPYAAGDPALLVAANEEAHEPRVVHLLGGVVVRDASGQTLAELEEVILDAQDRTIRSSSRATIHLPDAELTVTGTGLHAGWSLRSARLERDVTIHVPVSRGRAEFGCAGAATLREIEKDGDIFVSLDAAVRVGHPLLSASCDHAEATVSRGKEGKGHQLRSAALNGAVRIDLGPDAPGGLEFAAIDRVVVTGEQRVVLEGRVRATRTGPTHQALGLGDRVIDIEAGGAELTVRRDDADRIELVEARFTGGITARDRGGSGFLEAGTLVYSRSHGRLDAQGDVKLRTPHGLVAAERLRVELHDKRRFDVALEGKKRVEYIFEGRLGPVGEARRGTLVLTCDDALDVAIDGDSARFAARENVRGDFEGSRLTCGSLDLSVVEKQLDSVSATGGVRLVDSEHGATVEGATLLYREDRAILSGTPARAALPEGRLIEGRQLEYHAEGAFRAAGDVLVVATLQGRAAAAEPWRIRCAEADGELADGRKPRHVRARGSVVADGPRGEHVEGERFAYDGETGAALLEGAPALLGRGEGLRIAAEAFDLTLKDQTIDTARARGKAVIDFRAEPGSDRARSFRRWRIELAGPATLAADRLVVAAGARLTAWGDEDAPLLDGQVGHALLLVRRDEGGNIVPLRLLGTKGVEVHHRGKKPASVTADRLEYEVGTQRVEVAGNARVDSRDWARHIAFKRLVFILTKDGIDLRQASRVEVVEARQE